MEQAFGLCWQEHKSLRIDAIYSATTICAQPGTGYAMTTTSKIEDKLLELNIELPGPSAAAGNYVPAVLTGNLLIISGQISRNDDGSPMVGRLGETLTVEEGQKAARSCAIQIIAAAKNALGDLGRIEKIVKLNGFVFATHDFELQPAVINGASDLMVEVFGPDIGSHARAAVGMGSLPFGVAVEIDAIIAVKDA
jgi:enamine deaminase RidA (YjgF/YER057c/UK114 family)